MSNMERNLGDWVEAFANLYKEPDSKRDPEHIWMAAMAHFSHVGEAIRKYDFLEIHKTSAHAFCWICGFINKLRTTKDPVFRIDEESWRLVGFKFPGLCGHCMKPECTCGQKETEEDTDKIFRYHDWLNELDARKDDFEHWGLSEWMSMFNGIFGAKTELRPLDSIGFHLLEEGGEEAKAIRTLTQFRHVDDEITIDPSFWEQAETLKGLVFLHNELVKKIMDHTGTTDEKSAREELRKKPSDTTPVVIQYKIVSGKLESVSELCDTFSWLCSVLLKCEDIVNKLNLKSSIDRDKWRIGKSLEKEYQTGGPADPPKCYACKKTSCECINFAKSHYQ